MPERTPTKPAGERPHHAQRVAAAVPREYTVVALLHDVVEDHPESAAFVYANLAPRAWDALDLLSRREEQRYSDYIGKIAAAKRGDLPRIGLWAADCAWRVKLADLDDNLNGRYGAPPSTLRRRYLRAVATLREAGSL